MSVDETQEAAEDAKFERSLLDSARLDALPSDDVERALQRFTVSLGLASLDVEAPAILARVAHRALLSWLAVGAVGGGLLSAAWFGLARPSPPESTPPSGSAPFAAGAAAASASQASAPASQAPVLAARAGASSEGAAPGRRAALRSDSSEWRQRQLAHAQPVGGASVEPDSVRERDERSSPQSTLLAEVALLDSVRAKLELDDPAGALNLVERYEREFPRGQLANEAAVLAMEALAATANQAELDRRAQRFLQESPEDPHAPQVRRLLAR